MDTAELVRQLSGEIQQLITRTEFRHVSCVELIVGQNLACDAGELEDAFEDFFDSHEEESMRGMIVEVRLVAPGDTFSSPGREGSQTATGYELLVSNLRGTN